MSERPAPMRKVKHGWYTTRTYKSWRSMRERCTNEKHTSWHRYGGRGIRFDPRWDDFMAFLADMGERPKNTTLDRIDSDGHYTPSNCRWGTQAEQNRSRTNNRYVTFRGERMTVAEFSRRCGLEWTTTKRRLKAGWDLERISSTPSQRPAGARP